MAQYEDLVVGKLTVAGGGVAGGVAQNVTGLKVVHKQVGPLTQSVFTLTDVPQAVVNGTEYQSTKLFQFPEGLIYLFGTTATLQQKTTSDPASTLNASVTGAVSLGTAAASSTTLGTTMADFLASTAFTSSATQNVAGTAVTGLLSTPAAFDGTSTAKSLYLNSAFATTTDVDADATQTWSGTVTVTWLHLGDK